MRSGSFNGDSFEGDERRSAVATFAHEGRFEVGKKVDRAESVSISFNLVSPTARRPSFSHLRLRC